MITDRTPLANFLHPEIASAAPFLLLTGLALLLYLIEVHKTAHNHQEPAARINLHAQPTTTAVSAASYPPQTQQPSRLIIIDESTQIYEKALKDMMHSRLYRSKTH